MQARGRKAALGVGWGVIRPGSETCTPVKKRLQGLPAAEAGDPAPGAGLEREQHLPARRGPRPRWRRCLKLQGSGNTAASPSQHPPPRSAQAAGPRPERRSRAREGEGRHLGRGGARERVRAAPAAAALAAPCRPLTLREPCGRGLQSIPHGCTQLPGPLPSSPLPCHHRLTSLSAGALVLHRRRRETRLEHGV